MSGPAPEPAAGTAAIHPPDDAATEGLLRAVPPARELRDRVREIARRDVAPLAIEVDAGARSPEQGYRALAGAGLGGLPVPQALGGLDAGTLAYVAAVEEVTAACGATATLYMTQMNCANAILASGHHKLARQFVPSLCSGERLGSIAITEPQAGSDVSQLRTRARRDGEQYVLDGAKTFITTGDRADAIVVFAVVPEQRGTTAFLVEGGTPGLSVGRVLHKLGQRGSSTVELFLEDCRVHASRRLGGEGDGGEIGRRTLGKARSSAAAQGVGFAAAALAHGLGWAHARGLLDRRRADAQDVQLAFAELRARTTAARALLYATARALDEPGVDAADAVALAKSFCTDTGMAVADAVLALMGADADRPELEAERILRDAKVTQIYDGTNEIQRIVAARALARAADQAA